MALYPNWQSPPQPNLNPNYQPPPYYNFPFPNPRSEATVIIPAAVAVAQQSYYCPQGADVSGFPNFTVANQYPIPEATAPQQQYYYHQQGAPQQQYYYHQQGAPQQQYYYHQQGAGAVANSHYIGDYVPEIPFIAPIPLAPPHMIPRERNNEPEKNESGKNELEKEEPEKILESGKSKAQPVHCVVCDVYCNTEEFLKLHEAGKKHLKNVAKLKAPIDTNVEGSKKKKSNEIAEPAYCQICNALCSSEENLKAHYQGKNHMKKLRLQGADIPKSGCAQMVMTNDENSNQLKRTAVEENSTKKKRKVLGCDGMPTHTMMRCNLCNIEVSSQIDYDSHIAGSKHAAVVKNLQQFLIVYCHQQEVTADNDEDDTQN